MSFPRYIRERLGYVALSVSGGCGQQGGVRVYGALDGFFVAAGQVIRAL